jgi:DNA-binding FadR family transcriptional regulator
MAQHQQMVEAIAARQSEEARNAVAAQMDGLIASIKKRKNSLPNWNWREIGL